MGKKKKYTAKQMIDALNKNYGAVYLAADSLGCSHQTVYNYIKNYATVREAYEWQDGKTTDLAELALRSAIVKEQAWAVKYRLSTKGKDRGYVERQEVEHGGGIDVRQLRDMSDEQLQALAGG